MYTREITVKNEVGLHARPATYFIQKANEFKSGIWVEKEERRVNAKSLLGVLSLGIMKDTTVTLIADGSDEKEAVDALAELIENLASPSIFSFAYDVPPALPGALFYPWNFSYTARAAASGTTAESCSSVAFFTAVTVPKCCRSRFFRASPTPGIPSSCERLAERVCFW